MHFDPFPTVPQHAPSWHEQLPDTWARAAAGLRQVEAGHFATGEEIESAYDAEDHDESRALEEDSFWYRHRTSVLIGSVLRHPPPGWLLDVGGGNGQLTHALRAAGVAAVLLEPGTQGVRNALRRGLAPVAQGTLEGAAFGDESVPAIGMFDVLEHQADDDASLREVWRVLQPGGRLYLTVPAYGSLWSDADERAGHFRRYRLDELRGQLGRRGFSMLYGSYFFSLLPPAILLGRTLPFRLKLRRTVDPKERQRITAREHGGQGALVRGALKLWAHGESHAAFFSLSLPTGSSILVVAEKPLEPISAPRSRSASR